MDTSPVTIVMYHYVRPLERTRYPAIKGRDLEAFRSQVDYLRSRFRMVSLDEVSAAVAEAESLGPRAALLTFDDGLADHFEYVTPVLVDAGVSGVFYPPAAAALERRLLDVHRIHFILASGADPRSVAEQIDDFVRAHSDLGPPEGFHDEHARPSRHDPAEVVYVKRMLQVGLPEEARSHLAATLFAQFVSVDETAFAEELYCSVDQLRLMHRVGMDIGSHGYAHQWLSKLTPSAQRDDLTRSLELLVAAGVDTAAGWSLCYPYGDYDDTTIALARELGCTTAVTTEVREADLSADHLMALPRLDTGDVPVSSAAVGSDRR